MQKFLWSVLLSILAVSPAFAQRDIGEVDVVADTKTIPVRVYADNPELNGLVNTAFGTHGRYHRVASGWMYDMHFSLAGANQVTVNVTKGPERVPVISQTVTGTNARNALMRAADVAVARTNGLGLHGYFASKLVFIGLRTGRKEVYVSDLFFTEVRKITSDRAIALTPRWSPDGQKVLYTSFLHGFPDIYLLDLATYQRTTFESFRGMNTGAHFSADGRHVAMILSGSGASEVWTSDAYGHGLMRRTYSSSAKSSPCWSPDGSRIVFAQEPGPQLYVMSAGGGGVQRLTSGIGARYCAEPDWSRTAPNKIAFTMKSGSYQIAVYDSQTGRSTQVSKAPFDGIEPCWLPDGRHLVYTARDRSTNVLSILDTETGKSTPISRGFGPALQANVWSPR